MKKVLITGGTGLVGTQLQTVFKEKNIDVVILTRNPKNKNEFKWDIDTKYIDKKAFDNVTHIIHLAGAGIADKRWTNTRKKELINSRVASANLLFQEVKKHKIQLDAFISASGIGYYGAVTSDKIFKENDPSEKDFIAEICVKWEKAAHQFKQLNIPVTILRTGLVLTKLGGALPKMNTPLFLTALGTGKQYMPWIHIDDLCNLYLKSVTDNHFIGTYNAVAPEHQTNKNFTEILSKVIHKAVIPLNAPTFILKIILGELSDILLKGSRVSSEKTAKVYTFLFPDLKTTLHNIYKNE